MNISQKVIVGISTGDINGIGIEVILKTFRDKRILEFCTPVIFGSSRVIIEHIKTLNFSIDFNTINSLDKINPNRVNILNCSEQKVPVNFGKTSTESGHFALQSLSEATKALKNNSINVLVTAPINKESIQSEKFKFPGHTEFLENELNGKSLMILMTDQLKIGLITGHIPIANITKAITPEIIKQKVETMYETLQKDFNIRKPKIAVLGLNPHCGDNGVIGSEDDTIIRPTIKEIRDSGKLVFGPYASDGFFGTQSYAKFDGVLAMYHDQGLAPFKALSFGNGVNFTAGLDKIRTSPDHGTGFDIAGQNKANHESFKEALFTAIDIHKKRKEYLNLKVNALKN